MLAEMPGEAGTCPRACAGVGDRLSRQWWRCVWTGGAPDARWWLRNFCVLRQYELRKEVTGWDRGLK